MACAGFRGVENLIPPINGTLPAQGNHTTENPKELKKSVTKSPTAVFLHQEQLKAFHSGGAPGSEWKDGRTNPVLHHPHLSSSAKFRLGDFMSCRPAGSCRSSIRGSGQSKPAGKRVALFWAQPFPTGWVMRDF